MPTSATRRALLPTPLEGWPLLALLAIYLLAGMYHIPWRGDDLTYLGPIQSILSDGNWLVPRIAGEVFFEYPPLYYWIGAVLAKLFQWLLPVHDSARLASSLCTAASLYWTALAARRLYGDSAFAPAILLGMGSIGLVVHAHETQPLLAQLAGMSLCYAGLAELGERPVRAGVQAGLGSSIAFLGGGLPGIFLTLPLFLLTPALCGNCRSLAVTKGIGVGIALAALLCGAWVGALGILHPAELAGWWQEELASSQPHSKHLAGVGSLFQLLGWFSWPLWPIAGWALWKNRRDLKTLRVAIPIISSVLALVLIISTGPLRPASILPVLPPLTLLAALGVSTLRRGAANAFDWFGITAFVFFAMLVWVGWSALYFGWPPGLGRLLMRQAPDLVRSPSVIAAVLGGIISASILALPMLTLRTPMRGATNWAVGMTLLWCLAVMLWQPWFEHTKNYKPVALELRKALDAMPQSCILRQGLDDTQRAALDYFAGLRTMHYSIATECPMLLTYNSTDIPDELSGKWHILWERRLGGGRKAETFRLYRRD